MDFPSLITLRRSLETILKSFIPENDDKITSKLPHF
jgi:hypothetical protein